MARVYDIMEKIKNGNERPTIKIDEDHVFNVNTSKNTALAIKAKGEDKKADEFEQIDFLIEAGLGKEAKKYIDSLDLSIEALGTIVNAIMAAIGGKSLEEVEEAAKKEARKPRK